MGKCRRVLLLLGAASGCLGLLAFPTVPERTTETISEKKTDTSLSVAGTLVVAANGIVAQENTTTVALGASSGAAAPALIKVAGGKFGNSHGSTKPTTVTLGAAGGAGSFLLTGGALGIARLNVSADAPGNGAGYIDIARIEGGAMTMRQCYNDNINTVRVTFAGNGSLGGAHGQGATTFQGNAAEVRSENGALIYFNQGNANPNMNTAGTSVRIVGAADASFLTQYEGTVTFNRGFAFANAGFVKFSGSSRVARYRFTASDIIGAGVNEQVDAVGIAREFLQPFRVEHLVGIDIEGDDDAAPLRIGVRVDRALDEILVSRVQAVENAEGARGTIEDGPVEVLICFIQCHV
jgi:hypothetical protein